MYIAPQLLLHGLVIFIVVMILPVFFAPKTFMEVLDKIIKNSVIVRIYALRLMFMAFLFLSNYRKLDGTWNMLISLLGRMLLIKSIVGTRFPGYLDRKVKTFFSNQTRILVLGVAMIILCALLVYRGAYMF